MHTERRRPETRAGGDACGGPDTCRPSDALVLMKSLPAAWPVGGGCCRPGARHSTTVCVCACREGEVALMLAPCVGNLHSKHRGGWAGTQEDDYSYGPQVGEEDDPRAGGLAGCGVHGEGRGGTDTEEGDEAGILFKL